LVPGVHVRTLVTVDLDADPLPVEDLCYLRILIGLVVHDVAPMAPHRSDVEQNRPILGARVLERLRSPREPLDGLILGGSEIRRLLTL
jgi:hypothetical protein